MSRGFTERPATPADYPHFVRLFPELATGDRVMSREEWEAELLAESFFLDDESAAVAYGYSTVMTTTGYIRMVVVAPTHRGRGLGRALMDAFLRRFRARGCDRICLNVRPDNVPAIALYTSFGMRPAYTSTSLQLGWDRVPLVPGDPEEVRATVVDPADDAALEKAFDLPAGQLATVRVRPGWVLVRLVADACPGDARLGLACFNPRFPGAFPFRVARPTLARALLEGMRPFALPEHDHVRVMVEADPDLRDALLAIGAEVKLAIVHYEGPLPPG